MVAGQAGMAGLKKTRVETRTENSHLREEIVAIFLDRGFGDVNGLTQIETERPDVEAPEKYPSLAACASPWRLPSRTAMTHVRWLHGQSGHESTDYTQSVVHCVGRWTGSSMCARTRMRGEVHVRPRPLVWKQTGRNQKQRQRQNNTRQDMRHGQDRTGQDRTGQDRTGQDRTGQDRTRLRDILSAHIISHPFFAGVQTADQFACWCL